MRKSFKLLKTGKMRCIIGGKKKKQGSKGCTDVGGPTSGGHDCCVCACRPPKK